MYIIHCISTGPNRSTDSALDSELCEKLKDLNIDLVRSTLSILALSIFRFLLSTVYLPLSNCNCSPSIHSTFRFGFVNLANSFVCLNVHSKVRSKRLKRSSFITTKCVRRSLIQQLFLVDNFGLRPESARGIFSGFERQISN